RHNKRFKRDSQRVAFLLCVGFCDYGVMQKLGSGVVCPLTGRYEPVHMSHNTHNLDVSLHKMRTACDYWN
ncbi:hypothetical protein, partial [Vibrio metschnikovii]|uniref:hypothetical protein n=1 Tax=Vibrio metschnikovii TaxID=28172 RepID=UPI0027E479D6